MKQYQLHDASVATTDNAKNIHTKIYFKVKPEFWKVIELNEITTLMVIFKRISTFAEQVNTVLL